MPIHEIERCYMFAKLPLTLAATATLMFGGAALAGNDSLAQSGQSPVYKESQPKPNAKPEEGAVKPDATMQKRGLYKNAAPSANSKPEEGSVKPDAATKRPEVYKESQAKPHAKPEKP
jgi:hypothetical protein